MAGDGEGRVQGGHLVEQLDPRGAVFGRGGVGDPDVLVLEQQDPADDRPVLGLPQVVAVGQSGVAALEVEHVALEGDVAGQLGQVDQSGGAVDADGLPGLELALVGGLDVLDHQWGGDDLGVGEGVGDDLGAPVEVGVGVADEDLGQGLAGVEDLGDQAVAVGAGEAGVDQERLLLAGDQGGGLVLGADGEVQVDDREVEGAHGWFLSW